MKHTYMHAARCLGHAVLAMCLAFVAGSHATETRAPEVAIDLTPVVTSGKAEMEVAETLAANSFRDHALILSFSTLGPAYRRTSDTVHDLVVTDQTGPVALVGPSQEGDEDLWRASRPVSGEVVVRYRVPAAPTDIPHHGPITYLQTSGGGLSGIFASFLLTPQTDTAFDMTIRWHLPPGQTAVSNVQPGDFRKTLAFSDLAETLFIAGPLVHDPDALSSHVLLVAGLAVPVSQIKASRPWFSDAFKAMRAAFNREDVDGYRIMVFSHDRQAFNSGTSRPGGFLFFLPVGQSLNSQENHPIIAHEMVHSLAAFYDLDSGDWYNEGIADYAAMVVPKAAGLYTSGEYLDIVNEEAAFYYLNALRTTPNEKIPGVKWSKNNAWSLGYTRGALYFANLDAGLRNHGSKTTVFQLVGKMNAMAKSGPLPPDAWKKLLAQYGGAWAVAQWQSMIDGKLLEPEPGAFGECLIARPILSGHYALGIAPGSFHKGDTIGPVDPSSNAFKAGLRQGDVLREAFVENEASRSFDRLVTLKVKRNGVDVDIRFSPRAGQDRGYRWFAKSGNPDRPCL